MTMMDLETVLTRDHALTMRQIGDETIIVSEKGDMLHTLNGVGQFVMNQIDGKTTLRVVLDRICSEYAVSEAVAKNDLMAFATELAEKGIVVPLLSQPR